MSRGFFSPTTGCLETFTSSERVFPCARAQRGCEKEREEEEPSSSSAEKRNFASAETAGVRSRLYRGLARGVVSRAERVRSAAVRHSINQSCCCCCCCCALHASGKRGRSNFLSRDLSTEIARSKHIVGYMHICEPGSLRCEFLAKVGRRDANERESGEINRVQKFTASRYEFYFCGEI